MRAKKTIDRVVTQFLRDKLDLIKSKYAPTELIVFGSRVTGNAHRESDIDIIIVSERFGDIPFPNRMGQFLIDIDPDIHIDAICYTPEEFEQKLNGPAPFVRDAVAEGIRIE